MDFQNINFSHFTQDTLRSIEASAKFAVNFNSPIVMPCHLIGGLASVNGEDVCSVLQSKGYDQDLSMESIARGMSDIPLASSTQNISFHPDIVNCLSRLSSAGESISIKMLTEELINSNIDTLNSYFVNAQDGINGNSNLERDYQADDESTGETVKQFCINMIELAAQGKYHHAIGRDEEVKRVLLILARSSKNNPMLVGEPGTGKTAIAEELALRLLTGSVPADLANLKLYSLDFSTIKASPDSVGVMKSILEEATNDESLVLFIDEIHMLISNCNCSDNDTAKLRRKSEIRKNGVKVLGYRRFGKAA